MSLHEDVRLTICLTCLKRTLTPAVLVMCVLFLLLNNWLISERYYSFRPTSTVRNLQSLPLVTDTSSAQIHQVTAPWSRLRFRAAGNEHYSRKLLEPENIADEVPDTCKIPRFDPTTEHPPYVSCRRSHPINGSCEVAKKVLFSKPPPACADVHQTTSNTICQIQNNEKDYLVKCFNHSCGGAISLGAINATDGNLAWTQMQSITILENAIRNFIKRNESNGNYGFCFLNCTLKNKTVMNQLLLIPKNFTHKERHGEGSYENNININVIWLDSTSHSHFYRSMPQTVRSLRATKENKNAHVFNFNLLQSMKGGSYHNTVAFTGGMVYPSSPSKANGDGIGNVLNLFRSAGYHVTWLDDLCWNYVAPLLAGPKFHKIQNELTSHVWESLQKLMVTKGIDDIGTVLMSCEILRANNIANPFKSTPVICHNGLFQTDYLMSSLQMLQTQLNFVRRPFFNYVSFNQGNEANARRIQTLDKSLSKFITFLSKQNNTLTLLFGDHGNKHRGFLKRSEEFKIEVAHPVFFVLASKNLHKILGMEKMKALEINQDRLVNILDLRQTLLTLSPVVDNLTVAVADNFDAHPDGLLHPIGHKRSCKSMAITPESNKCICEEGQKDRKFSYTTGALIIAEFALGELNNQIQEQFLSANSDSPSGFGSCERLVGSRVTNIQATKTKDTRVIMDMDIHVPAGSSSPQVEDVFSVVVEVTSTSQNKSSISLLHYERISTFTVYDDCRDNGVEGDLCICSPSNRSDIIRHWYLQPATVFGKVTKVIFLNKYVFIHERRSPFGIVLEASVDNTNETFQVEVDSINMVNVVPSKPSSIMVCVKPGMIYFIGAFYQLDSSQKWLFEYDLKFRQLL